MASILKLDEIQHTNGTTAATVGTGGVLSIPRGMTASQITETRGMVVMGGSGSGYTGWQTIDSRTLGVGTYIYTCVFKYTNADSPLGGDADQCEFEVRVNGTRVAYDTFLDDDSSFFNGNTIGYIHHVFTLTSSSTVDIRGQTTDQGDVGGGRSRFSLKILKLGA